jgi:hypothetical protein
LVNANWAKLPDGWTFTIKNNSERITLPCENKFVLEEYATRLVSAEAVHLREMELMAMQRAPD